MAPPNPTDFDPTATGNWAGRPIPSHSDFQRLEDRLSAKLNRIDERTGERLDKISDALHKVVQLQADIINQGRRMDAHERHSERQDELIEANRVATEQNRANLEKWVNRGFGAWGLLVAGFALWEKFHGG